MRTDSDASTMETVIEPAASTKPIPFAEIWAFRELLYQLVWRDLSVRYKQSFLGVAWVVVTPLITAGIFALIFGLLARMPTNDVPFISFFLAGLMPYLFFSGAMSSAANSMVAQRSLVTKVYFPRILLPLSATLTPLVDFLAAMVVLLCINLYQGFVPDLSALLWVPGVILWVWMAATGLGLWLGALNVYYRDVRQVVPFLVRVFMFASPVLYPVSMIPEKWHWLYAFNPIAGAIEWFRWALFGTTAPPSPVFFISFAVTLLLLVTGVPFFRRVEQSFADVV